VEVALPVQSTAVALSTGRHGGSVGGLECINGKGVKDNATRTKTEHVRSNVEYTLLCRVTVEGTDVRIEATLDGKPYVAWKGPVRSLSLPGGFSVRRPDCPALGAVRNPVTFKSARLRMLSGEARPVR